MNLQKIMILNSLKAFIPGVTKLLIDIEAMQMTIELANGTVKNEPAKGMEYFAQVCEAYGLKTIKTIYIDFPKKDILLRGIDNIDEPKDIIV